ncbi:MAG: ABC transporter permease [Treponema sp. GWB1_62_6]|nr:MAG: ABC transporter permease [Treponema sp. GWA1_62_8]OHE64814.1 MAG: ABC transporter permease [Treponema sp. GWC1_61_84]OHE68420.1 MAG: ABC transporter permease [Treponema sp. GWB1_62_6]OHE72599.1 MAG: ABC transporter permease [Treponema sp. RIFOXYC1_FULL_61_9]HCM27659.1 branched-chain amino acid ABC transporter permease [Treponema sp.]
MKSPLAKIADRRVLDASLVAVLLAGFFVADSFLDPFAMQIFKLCAINIILALSLNLLNGFTGLFSLGHAGFMSIGAFSCALLTMTAAQKQMNFFLKPIEPWLMNVTIPFLPALIISGLIAAFAGFLIGAPALRLRDDYLAIATLGFSEIIRVVFTNLQTVTNGSLGLKGLPRFTTMWWAWGVAAAVTVLMVSLVRSSYGRAFKAIRDNEIAAEAMGINVFRMKLLSFVISAFIAGIGGALLAHHLTTIDPKQFQFLKTFDVLLIVVLGGIGSISGSIIAAIVVTIMMEALRFLDGPLNLIFIQTEGTPGIRMVVFSVLLMAVILFRQQGLMGQKELSWDLLSKAGLLPRFKAKE